MRVLLRHATGRGFLDMLVLILVGVWGHAACAQDTTIYVILPNVCTRPCSTLHIPLILFNFAHTIAGYQVSLTLSNPDLVYFEQTDLIDTAGTPTETWDYSGGTAFPADFGTSARLAGMADLPEVPGSPLGISPQVAQRPLVYLIAHVYCDPDTLFGRTVSITANTVGTQFSDPEGMPIEPYAFLHDTMTVLFAGLGDMNESGDYNIVDVVTLIGCAFRATCPGCVTTLGDLDCDNDIDIVDTVKLIGHVFRGDPVPVCP
jgi:hypothetical protein